MAAGKINLQANDGKVAGIVFEDGASGNVAVTVPKDGGKLAADSSVVHKTGDETVEGIKTFSSSPIVPTPTTGTQAVNKDYADLKVALASFVGTNQSLSGNGGYQKLPGGLIIQWMAVNTTAASDIAATFPITFPNAYLKAVLTVGVGGGFTAATHNGATQSTLLISAWNSSGRVVAPVACVVIGY